VFGACPATASAIALGRRRKLSERTEWKGGEMLNTQHSIDNAQVRVNIEGFPNFGVRCLPCDCVRHSSGATAEAL
jgi:hypothetical protein